MTENRKPRFFYGYFVVLAAFLIQAVMWGAQYSFGVFFKPLLTEFGWTRAMTSSAYSLFMFLSGFLSIFTGRLNDRLGPRIVVTACGLFLGLGYLLMSQIDAIWQLYLFYGVMVAIGISGGFVPLTSTVARWFVKRRGLMTGIVMAGVGVGTMVIPAVASWLIYSYGWRVSYVVIGSIALLFVVLAAQFLRHDPGQMGQLPYGANEIDTESIDLGNGGFSLLEAIHAKQFWLLCALWACYGFCNQTIMVHIVICATGLGILPASAAGILGIIGGLSIAGRIITGSVADRIGNKLALLISFILMALALFWLTGAKEMWMFYLFAAVFGFSYGGLAALISPTVAELFGLSSLGVILGIITFAITIGGAIGPVVAGHIFDVTSSYQLALLICAIVGIIAIILTLFLRPITIKEGKNDSKRSS